MAVIETNKREKVLEVDLPNQTGVGKTDWLRIPQFPIGSLHVLPDAGVTYSVEISNYDLDSAAIVPAGFGAQAAKGIFILNQGAAFVRVNVTGGAGTARARFVGALQS